MAVQGSGTKPMGATVDPAMADQTKFDARSGAAKKTQVAFPVKDGMKDQTTMSRVGPGMQAGGKPDPTYHFGPDASSANPSDPESPAERGKVLRRQPGALVPGPAGEGSQYEPGSLKSTWGMKGGNGQGVEDNVSGKAVLAAAVQSGSTKLPATTSEQSGPGPARGK
jgi:hypothetical protein